MPLFKFTATTIMNAFILNSILISFSVVFMTTLKSYEQSLNHTTMLYILDGLTATFLILMGIYYSINHKKTKHDIPIGVIVIIFMFLIANITLTLLDHYGIKIQSSKSSDNSSNTLSNKSSPLQVYILFLITFFATIFIYYLMNFLFGFGGGMLANEQTN